MDNISEGLKHNDRICELLLNGVFDSQLNRILEEMQQPFPELTCLMFSLYPPDLQPREERLAVIPVIPDSFLGGSAPRLQELTLIRIPFPGLPILLLSAAHLTRLWLFDIPHLGYIPPEAMAACLSGLTRLEDLLLEFKSRPSREIQRQPPQTRTLLPTLTSWEFRGACEYLEDLVGRIDAPLLDDWRIHFFHQTIFDTSQLDQFIIRTPKFNTHHEARVIFSYEDISFTLPQPLGGQFHLTIG
jgi:hypothetical protein